MQGTRFYLERSIARLPSALEIHVYLVSTGPSLYTRVCTVLIYFVSTVNPAECILQSVGHIGPRSLAFFLRGSPNKTTPQSPFVRLVSLFQQGPFNTLNAVSSIQFFAHLRIYFYRAIYIYIYLEERSDNKYNKEKYVRSNLYRQN